MKKKIGIFIIVSLIMLTGIWAINFYHKPLAPSPPKFGDVVNPTATVKPQYLKFLSGTSRNILTEMVEEDQGIINPICDGPPEMIILATGVDSRGDIHHWGLSDIIWIARFDLVNKTVSVLSIPRDLWVPMYGLEEYNVTEFRINSAYYYGNLYDYPGGGPIFLAKTIYDNFGIQIDHYLSINRTAFIEIVDELGGVDITFPENSSSDVNYLYRGSVHFSGEKALLYIENRKDSTWNRTDRALYFVQAIKNQVLQPKTILKLTDLMGSLKRGVVTDFSPADIAMLQCIASEINTAEFQFYEIGPNMTEVTYIRDYWALLPQEDLIEEHIKRFLAGEPSEYKP